MSKAKIINIKMARQALKEVVEEKGRDFRYVTNPGEDQVSQGCFNVPITDRLWRRHSDKGELLSEHDVRRTTGCGVGEAIGRFGYKTQLKSSVHSGSSAIGLPNSWFDMDERCEYKYSSYSLAQDYLSYFQARQDRGETWGEALDAAEEWWNVRKDKYGEGSSK